MPDTDITPEKVIALAQQYPWQLDQVRRAAAVASSMEVLKAACDMAIQVPTFVDPWGGLKPMTPMLAVSLVEDARSGFD